jgi:integrase
MAFFFLAGVSFVLYLLPIMLLVCGGFVYFRGRQLAARSSAESVLHGEHMAAAVDAGMIPRTPCRRVPLPKIDRQEMRFLSPQEIARLAAAIRPDYRALILLGAYGGLRIGEMAGLRRGRVDLAQGLVQVVEVVIEPIGKLHIGPPKTRAARRTVGLPSSWSRRWPSA